MNRDQRAAPRPRSRADAVPAQFQDISTDRHMRMPDAKPFVSHNPQAEGPRNQLLGGRYSLGGAVGTGGMSTVHLAFDMRTGTPVAVKLALPYVGRSGSCLEAEADALSRMDHPGIVRFIGSGVHDGNQFMVMEYLRAKELQGLIRQYGPLSWQSSAPALLEICDALGHVHEAGFVHGDVKPSNIMLLPVPSGVSPSVKLIDFGLARRADEMGGCEDRAPAYLRGTLPYIAPEQMHSLKAFYDIRADIYAMGVMMYGMLTRVNPFEGTGRCQVEDMLSIMNEVPPHPSSVVGRVPRMAGDIAMRAIAKRPGERFQSMAELKEAILSAI